MATNGTLTVGKLKAYLDCYPDDTRVVMGQIHSDGAIIDCHANTYYNPDVGFDEQPWIIIDAGDNL